MKSIVLNEGDSQEDSQHVLKVLKHSLCQLLKIRIIRQLNKAPKIGERDYSKQGENEVVGRNKHPNGKDGSLSPEKTIIYIHRKQRGNSKTMK